VTFLPFQNPFINPPPSSPHPAATLIGFFFLHLHMDFPPYLVCLWDNRLTFGQMLSQRETTITTTKKETTRGSDRSYN